MAFGRDDTWKNNPSLFPITVDETPNEKAHRGQRQRRDLKIPPGRRSIRPISPVSAHFSSRSRRETHCVRECVNWREMPPSRAAVHPDATAGPTSDTAGPRDMSAQEGRRLRVFGPEFEKKSARLRTVPPRCGQVARTQEGRQIGVIARQ
jgi:hypothetical protein